VKRTNAEFQLSYPASMSRHGARVRTTQRMPLIAPCLSEIDGPTFAPIRKEGSKIRHSRVRLIAPTHSCPHQKGNLNHSSMKKTVNTACGVPVGSLQSSSILTSLPDAITSILERSRHIKFLTDLGTLPNYHYGIEMLPLVSFEEICKAPCFNFYERFCSLDVPGTQFEKSRSSMTNQILLFVPAIGAARGACNSLTIADAIEASRKRRE
jgi:hypothetical protein